MEIALKDKCPYIVTRHDVPPLNLDTWHCGKTGEPEPDCENCKWMEEERNES